MGTMICIQCSMRALLKDEAPPSFDETPEEHMKKHHPDMAFNQKERKELERLLSEKFKEK